MAERTPPEVVAAADNPAAALKAFIGQELEHWGFKVTDEEDSMGLVLRVESDEITWHYVVVVGTNG